MKSKIAIFIFVSFFILGCLFFPKYIIHSDDYGYKIADSYARKYYIDCERPALYKKERPVIGKGAREWLKEEFMRIYDERVRVFDKSGTYMSAMINTDWVNLFEYKYTLLNAKGEVSGDTYESIFFHNGLYYHINFTYSENRYKYNDVDFFYPTWLKTNYSYYLDVSFAKKSCSHPQ